ncbi:TetR family transcriptional regulator [Halieaceae bacterium IMCC14734]|uniref:TetR family transcriptional regulator n=1 Tax=Candidatus Litorirhabdus singularis TaxID=2518993 RepID=A0ABT3TIS5_9GAMM|nr:TetR/AcrR family transcriptional regulator [Candidatus Litorirhabdus singularis]MCX2982207.1 TetR family transcriptional regulator [Candidatus Litorirhabdus singularis]
MTDQTTDTLLKCSARLFAERGFAGTSMRQIAREAGITQAAIYHHFANKQALYVAAVSHLHRDKIGGVQEIRESTAAPAQKLTQFILLMLQQLDADPDFRHIFFRELIEGDEARLQDLAANVFPEIAQMVESLMQELAPHLDSHLTMLSISGLILLHLEARPLSLLLTGGAEDKTRLPILAEHITTLLLNGVRTA